MTRTKYPISKEFFPFNRFSPPLSWTFVLMAQKFMKTPKLLWKDPALDVQSRMIPGYQGGRSRCLLFRPRLRRRLCPAWSISTAGYNRHYQMGMTYARESRCKVIYVRYRLAPKYSFPVPQEDCCAVLGA